MFTARYRLGVYMQMQGQEVTMSRNPSFANSLSHLAAFPDVINCCNSLITAHYYSRTMFKGRGIQQMPYRLTNNTFREICKRHFN